MSRRALVAGAKRTEPVVQHTRTLKADHPFLRYRRIWAHQRFVDGP